MAKSALKALRLEAKNVGNLKEKTANLQKEIEDMRKAAQAEALQREKQAQVSAGYVILKRLHLCVVGA